MLENEKLMFFDVYRAISVKLLRIRLESQDESDDEKIERKGDFRYRDWLLRPVSEGAPKVEINIERALAPIKTWFDGKSDDNVLMVLGDQGSGKTELGRQLAETLNEVTFKSVDIEHKTLTQEDFLSTLSSKLEVEIETIEQLVTADAELEKQVVIIDSTCNLFLSEVGCLDGYRALIDVMNAELKNVFWVVLMYTPSWNYLKYVFDKEQRFGNIYKMQKWSASDIRKLILTRHQGSQLRLKYDDMLVSASVRSESASVRSSDSRVFNLLWEQSNGNPLVALLIWLASVNSTGRILEVGVPQRPTSEPLNDVPEDAQFVYAALMFHKSLTIAEIMKVSHFSDPVVRQALKYGLNSGFILVDDKSAYYINPLWQGVLTTYLQRKNMLW